MSSFGYSSFGIHATDMGADVAARVLLDPEKKTAHWSEFADGGHFPAMEVPQLLVQDLRRFFGTLPH